MLSPTGPIARRAKGVVSALVLILPAWAGSVPAHPGPSADPRPTGARGAESPPTGEARRIRVGAVDLEPHEPRDATLESLVLSEKYIAAFDRAVRALRRSAERSGPSSEATLSWLYRVGTVALLSGDLRTAEEVFRAELPAQRLALRPNDPRIAETLVRYGVTARYREDRPLARRLYDEARGILDTAGPGHEPILAALEQGEADWLRRDDPDAATTHYKRALELRRLSLRSPSFPVADNLVWLAFSLSRARRFDEARAYLHEAQRELRALGGGPRYLQGTVHHLLADRLLWQDRWDEAEVEFAATAEVFTALHREGSSRHPLPLDGYEGLALAALRRGEGEKAWRLLETGSAVTHLDMAGLGLWRQLEPASYREVTALRRELLAEKRVLALGGATASWTPSTWRPLTRALELRARIAAMEVGFLSRHLPEPPSLDAARALLGPRSAMIGFVRIHLGEDPPVFNTARYLQRIYVLRDRGPIVWVQVPEKSAGTPWSAIDRASRWPLRVDADPETMDVMRSWTRTFVEPALPYLSDVDQLIVDDPHLPVESYIDGSGRWIGDAFDISYIPSVRVASLLAARDAGGGRRAGTRSMESVLTVSGEAPDVSVSPAAQLRRLNEESSVLQVARSAFPRDDTPLDRLPVLPCAALEGALVSSRFARSTLLDGESGAEGRLRRLADRGGLTRFDVLHFTAHTLTDVSPEKCALVLSSGKGSAARADGVDDDGLLDVEEIQLGWELDARLVTLSGCETAISAGTVRNEAPGFVPALFSVGARNVLSSLWPVDDRATTLLMDRFYANLTGRAAGGPTGEESSPRAASPAPPMPPARALREAKAYLRGVTDDRGRHPFEHPIYWAGFILVGVPEKE